MKARSPNADPGALAVLGEAFHLLRRSPAGVLAAYYVGTLPFVLGLLFFWADMSRSALAARRCIESSFVVALLFLWMKVWQSAFARALRARITGLPARRLDARGLTRLVAGQAALQGSGLVLLPLALLLAFPFCAVYAFYQNLTALGDSASADLRAVSRRAWRQALLWPRQNHVLVWLLCPWVLGAGMLAAFGGAWLATAVAPELREIEGTIWFLAGLVLLYNLILPLCPFGCVVAGNLALVVAALPELLRSAFGVQTVFTLSGLYGMLNTTFLMTVFGLTYLCLDPLVKASYTLRCFYGEARGTGADLLAELRAAGRP